MVRHSETICPRAWHREHLKGCEGIVVVVHSSIEGAVVAMVGPEAVDEPDDDSEVACSRSYTRCSSAMTITLIMVQSA